MNYQKIHDFIIDRARQRNICDSVYTEKHHIIPKCEGGLESGEVVNLTLKEHRLIHILRYKITSIDGNLIASYLMKNTDESVREARKTFAKKGAKYYHEIYSEQNPEKYIKNQRKAGKIAGEKCKKFSLGFLNYLKKKK